MRVKNLQLQDAGGLVAGWAAFASMAAGVTDVGNAGHKQRAPRVLQETV